MRRFTVLAAALSITSLFAAPAPNPFDGDWEGEARTDRWPLFLSLTLRTEGDTLGATLRVLGQTVEFPHAASAGDSITLRTGEGANRLTLEFVHRDSVLVGLLTQRADSLPVTLYRVDKYPKPADRVAAWTQDLDALATRFLRWDRSFSDAERQSFIAAITDTRDQLGELTDNEVIVRMASAIGSSGNAHSRLYLVRNRTALRRLPVRLWWFRDGLRVMRTAPEHRRLLGCRVDDIDGTLARHARDIVAPVFAGNPSWVDYMSVYSLTSPEILAGTGIGLHPDSVVLGVSDCAVGTARATVAALPLAKSSDPVEAWWDLTPSGPAPAEEWVHVLGGTGTQQPLYLRHPDLYYWFEYLPESDILYFQYNRSSEMADESTERFGERLLAELDRRQPAALVVDLRFNTGGNTNLASQLMKSLEERTRGMSRWVITGRATFSAGIAHAAAWRAAGKVTFVGEPVGDGMEFWSEGGNVRLPNSGLDAHFANGYHSYSVEACPADVPCFNLDSPAFGPDIPIAMTWEEYRAGTDPAMAAILAATDR